MPPIGYTLCVQVTIEEDFSYRVHVLLCEVEGSTVSDETEMCALLKIFLMLHLSSAQGLSWYTTLSTILKLFISILRVCAKLRSLFIRWIQLIVSYGLKSQLMHH